jgi:3-methyladenine DNA glycosylase Tag
MTGMSVFGKYLSKMKLKQWKDYGWADTERLKAIAEEKAKQFGEPDEIMKQKIEELMKNEKIVRHRKKIEAAISNSKIFKEIQKEYGSFSEYIWHFTNHKVIIEENKTTSPLSDEVSKDLKKRGMKFVGSTIVYSYLQAIGVINSHEKDCFCYFYK